MKKLNLRLSDELHAELVASAKAEHRSLQAEIVMRLETHRALLGTASTEAGLSAGADESADQSGRESGAGSLNGGDSGEVHPTGVAPAPAESSARVVRPDFKK